MTGGTGLEGLSLKKLVTGVRLGSGNGDGRIWRKQESLGGWRREGLLRRHFVSWLHGHRPRVLKLSGLRESQSGRAERTGLWRRRTNGLIGELRSRGMGCGVAEGGVREWRQGRKR